MERLKWLKLKNHIPTPPTPMNIPNFFVDLPQAQADDSANVLREKAPCSSPSLRRNQMVPFSDTTTPGWTAKLQNPGSELYLHALELIMKIT